MPETMPWALDGQTTGSVVDVDSDVARHAIQGVLAGAVGSFAGGIGVSNGLAHGVCGPTHLKVTQSSTPGMSVRVAAGVAYITGTASAQQGPYSFYEGADVDIAHAISPGDPTNPRNDIVCAQVRDTDFDASGAKGARYHVVEGTPAGAPVDPALPAGCLALARVRVDANESTSIVNADITDVRTKGGTWWLPRGVIDTQFRRSDILNYTSTFADVTDCTITWTTEASRRYRIRGACPAMLQETSAPEQRWFRS